MDQETIFLIIMGMALVTYLPRFLPAWLLSTRSLPRKLTAWLKYVPVAVLSAMLMPSLLIRNERLDLSGDNIFLWAALPTFMVAAGTRSLFGSVLTGMVLVAGARFWFGY